MKTVLSDYGLIQKEAWGPGPWQDEPDRLEWVDAATGLTCLVVRAPLTGSLCGYVGVPPGHPYHGRHYDAIDDVYVHGGLTYSDYCQGAICHTPRLGEPEPTWWLGFDTGHAFDLTPALNARLREYSASIEEAPAVKYARAQWRAVDVYRPVEYVRAECAALAAQIREAWRHLVPEFSPLSI
jgi:hypothetical protein